MYRLVPHGAFPPDKVEGVTVHWSVLTDGRLMLRFKVTGAGALVVPAFKGKGRADDLWKATCFELFLDMGEGRYREFNFSPSQQWAAWEFGAYRAHRNDREPALHPDIQHERGATIFTLTTFLSQRELDGATRASLTAVLVEEGSAQPSYWALAHAKSEPDFHDPACFRIALDPAGQA